MLAKVAELDSLERQGTPLDSLAVLWGGLTRSKEYGPVGTSDRADIPAALDSLVFGKDERPAPLAVGATTFTGNGGTGGQTHWTDNKCSGAGGFNSTVIAGVSGTGTGGTALTSGAGGQGSPDFNLATTAGGAGYSNSITGSATSYGGGGGGGGWGGYGGSGAGISSDNGSEWIDVEAGGQNSGPTYWEVCVGPSNQSVNDCQDINDNSDSNSKSS